MIWYLIGAFVAGDIMRGRGHVATVVSFTLMLCAVVLGGVSFPGWLGVLLVVGCLKELGVVMHWRPFGLPVLTTPGYTIEPRALSVGEVDR